jgi:tetratricopeptide (TPR) repeat protein
VTLEEVRNRLGAATEGRDWRGVLKWEGRLEQLLEGRSDAARVTNLFNFKWAHSWAWSATDSTDHALAVVRLQDRRIEILGNMERFRDQGEAICDAAEHLVDAGKVQEAAGYFQRARDVGAAHGFFSVECKACLGLGRVAIKKGRLEEGADLLRNALAASSLREDEDDTYMEVEVLDQLTEALFRTRAIDEVEPLVLRFRETAEALSRKVGCLCFWELESLYASARLLEVGNPSTPPLPCFRQGKASVRGSSTPESGRGLSLNLPCLQARGKPQAAEREVRALLYLLRENGDALQDELIPCRCLLQNACTHLTILHPELGDEELVKSVAAKLANVTALIAGSSPRQ